MQYAENTRLSLLPPMARTTKTPEEIVDKYFSYDDKISFIKFLIGYQKTQIDWEVYRKKITDSLLDKFAKIIQECRENGFMRPRVREEKIVWDRVYAFKRNHQNVDKCSMCPRTFVAGDCKGKLKYKIGQKMFNPCWAAEGI